MVDETTSDFLCNRFAGEVVRQISVLAEGSENLDWEEIHLRYFKCFIGSRLRSFYFKISTMLLLLIFFFF